LTAAARALIDVPEMSAEDVAKKAMDIASNMCVYTNDNFVVQSIEGKKDEEK
jgi:ATP-dependent HslUV protease subunit HslV